MQFVGPLLSALWGVLVREAIPKPKLQQVWQKLKRRIFYRSNFCWTKTNLQNFEKFKRPTTCCLRNKILGNRTRPAFYLKNLKNLKSLVGFWTGSFQESNAMRHVTRECLHGKFRLSHGLQTTGPCSCWNRSRLLRLARTSSESGPCSSCRGGSDSGTELVENFADLGVISGWGTPVLANRLNDFMFTPQSWRPEIVTPNMAHKKKKTGHVSSNRNICFFSYFSLWNQYSWKMSYLWWSSTIKATLTIVPKELWGSKIHTQRLPAGLMMFGPKATKWLMMAIDWSPVTLAEASRPRNSRR